MHKFRGAQSNRTHSAYTSPQHLEAHATLTRRSNVVQFRVFNSTPTPNTILTAWLSKEIS